MYGTGVVVRVAWAEPTEIAIAKTPAATHANTTSHARRVEAHSSRPKTRPTIHRSIHGVNRRPCPEAEQTTSPRTRRRGQSYRRPWRSAGGARPGRVSSAGRPRAAGAGARERTTQ